jgi:hypothetical protein
MVQLRQPMIRLRSRCSSIEAATDELAETADDSAREVDEPAEAANDLAMRQAMVHLR